MTGDIEPTTLDISSPRQFDHLATWGCRLPVTLQFYCDLNLRFLVTKPSLWIKMHLLICSSRDFANSTDKRGFKSFKNYV